MDKSQKLTKYKITILVPESVSPFPPKELPTAPTKPPKPASLKKNRFNSHQLLSNLRPTIDSDDSSEGGHKPSTLIKLEGLKKIDSLLELIDALRVNLGKLRAAEFTELAAFEAVMLNWEAVLKVVE